MKKCRSRLTNRDLSQRITPVRGYGLGGFSLIELIICLMLLSILVGFAVPRYKAYLERKDRQKPNSKCCEFQVS